MVMCNHSSFEIRNGSAAVLLDRSGDEVFFQGDRRGEGGDMEGRKEGGREYG